MSSTRPKCNRLLFLILDGFDSKYLKHCPFLTNLARENAYGELEIPPGFGPRAVIFSGTYPETNNTFSDHWFTPETGRFRFFRNVNTLVESIWRWKYSKFIVRGIVRLLTGFPAHIPPNIPLRNLSYFDVPKPAIPFILLKGNSDPPNLIQILRENRISYKFVVDPIGYNFLDYKHQVLIGHIKKCDEAGHKFGPTSPEMIEYLRILDEKVMRIIKTLENRFENTNILIISDHGMCEVKNKINILEKINALKLKPFDDYFLFLDSTMARFWFRNLKVKMQIEKTLSEQEGGHILTEEERGKYRLRFNHNKYGELIFWVDKGYILSPNFYGSNVNGMHGYLQNRAKGIFLLKTNSTVNIKNNVNLIDVFPTTLDLLDIKIPSACEGISRVKKR